MCIESCKSHQCWTRELNADYLLLLVHLLQHAMALLWWLSVRLKTWSKSNIIVKFVTGWYLLPYSNSDPLENLRLCDWVSDSYSKFAWLCDVFWGKTCMGSLTTKNYNKNCKRVLFMNVHVMYCIPAVKAAGQILLSSALHIMRIIDEKLLPTQQ